MNIIFLQVLYVLRGIAAVIAITRGVFYTHRFMCLWEQKSKMKRRFFPFWHFALSLFLFI